MILFSVIKKNQLETKGEQMSLGEEIIEPFYRDPRHSEGDFFQFYYRPFLHIAIFTINSTERCFLVYNLYDKCIK